MVEFPLLVRSARGLRRRLRNLSQTPTFADINFASSNRRLTQASMWETNTFAASFHARLNVAAFAVFGLIFGAKRACPGLHGLGRGRPDRASCRPLQFVTNCATPWPASGSAPAACPPAPTRR